MKEVAAHSDDASGSGAPRLAGLRGPAFVEAARRLLAEAPPPQEGWEAARAVCADLRRFYGGRLRRVVLFGSFARGDANDDSDVDLLVVLDRVDNYREERNRLSDLTWEHFLRSNRVVQAIPVTEEELARSDKPVFVNARREGVELPHYGTARPSQEDARQKRRAAEQVVDAAQRIVALALGTEDPGDRISE